MIFLIMMYVVSLFVSVGLFALEFGGLNRGSILLALLPAVNTVCMFGMGLALISEWLYEMEDI